MVSSSSVPIANGGIFFFAQHSSTSMHRSAILVKWGLKSYREVVLGGISHQAFRVLANANASSGKSVKEVIMVDPSEAKRLATKQMEEIKAKEKFKRNRQIEAINGAWAMIGLTAGLVIEGRTGNSILSQLAGYWVAFVGLFTR